MKVLDLGLAIFKLLGAIGVSVGLVGAAILFVRRLFP